MPPKENMSKKNKAKFKKHLKSQILQDINREVNLPQAIQPASVEKSEPMPTPKINKVEMNDAKNGVAAATVSDSMIVNLPQVKYDLKKTAIIILILAGIIAALAILDQKYNILISLGDWLFKIFNIQ